MRNGVKKNKLLYNFATQYSLSNIHIMRAWVKKNKPLQYFRSVRQLIKGLSQKSLIYKFCGMPGKYPGILHAVIKHVTNQHHSEKRRGCPF